MLFFDGFDEKQMLTCLSRGGEKKLPLQLGKDGKIEDIPGIVMEIEARVVWFFAKIDKDVEFDPATKVTAEDVLQRELEAAAADLVQACVAWTADTAASYTSLKEAWDQRSKGGAFKALWVSDASTRVMATMFAKALVNYLVGLWAMQVQGHTWVEAYSVSKTEAQLAQLARPICGSSASEVRAQVRGHIESYRAEWHLLPWLLHLERWYYLS